MTQADVKRMFAAIESGALETVNQLIDADPALLEAAGIRNANDRDKTPLMYALQCQRFHLAKRLIERGANVGAKMTSGPRLSVIALCVRFQIMGRSNADIVDMVNRLLDGGAAASDALWPALHVYTKKHDQTQVIELLLQRGADPDAPVGNTGSTVRELVEINAKLYSDKVLAMFR